MTARRIGVAIVGAIVTLVGVGMLILPGPAIVVIPTGLAILATEFTWAQRWLATLKRRGRATLELRRPKLEENIDNDDASKIETKEDD